MWLALCRSFPVDGGRPPSPVTPEAARARTAGVIISGWRPARQHRHATSRHQLEPARPGRSNLDQTPKHRGGSMSEQDDFPERFHRDRREHGGASQRLDDDHLARLTEEERVAAGLDAYDPDEVPPATDTPPQPEDITQNEDWQEERAEFRREEDEG